MNALKPNVKLWCALAVILFLSSFNYAQSGRRVIHETAATPEQEVSEQKSGPATITARPSEPPPAPAESQDYHCGNDGSPVRILDPRTLDGPIVSTKEVDTRVVITAKPRPAYTREARRLGVQGFVTLRVLFSARTDIGRVRVVKGLRSGLTENAIRAACRMEFKPALKSGQPMGQWLLVEYVFRLADSSIFTP
jgi:TonB family protein